MKYLATLLLTLAFFCPQDALAADPLKNLGEIIKKNVTIKASGSALMNVTFNHENHMGKGFGCANCHHEKLAGKSYVPCANDACHSAPGPRERGAMSMFMAFHARGSDRSCYGCHSKLSAENPEKYPSLQGCRPCHMSPQARQEALSAGRHISIPPSSSSPLCSIMPCPAS
jgi:hypothetical protein